MPDQHTTQMDVPGLLAEIERLKDFERLAWAFSRRGNASGASIRIDGRNFTGMTPAMRSAIDRAMQEEEAQSPATTKGGQT